MNPNRIAILITNYNMPERANALVEAIRQRVKWPHDLILVDNGSDLEPPSLYTTLRLANNIQTTGGWLKGLDYAGQLALEHGEPYLAYWFLITSAEFLPGGGDPLAPLAELLLNDPNAVGVHPALAPDSTTNWEHLVAQGGDQPRRAWMIDNIASLYRADWFDSIGRFDPALTFAHGIDLETCWKARREGRSLWVHEGSQVKKISNIGYTMNRMNMTASDRVRLAKENMDAVLGQRYGADYWERLMNEYRDYEQVRSDGFCRPPANATEVATTNHTPVRSDGFSRPPAMNPAILLVAHGFPPKTLGGVELYTYYLAQELSQRGHHVRVLYPEWDDTRPAGEIAEAVFDNIPVTILNLNRSANQADTFKNEAVAAVIERCLSELKIDVVHFNHLIGVSASALHACARLGLPTVLTLHDGWLLCEQIHFNHPDGRLCPGPETIDNCAQCFAQRHPEIAAPGKLPEIYYTLALRRDYLQRSLGLIHTITVPTRFLRDRLEEFGFQHPRVILAPLGLKPFPPLPLIPRQGRVRFTCLGSIYPTKGTDVLIRAFNQVDPQKAQLDLYGNILDPGYYEKTMALIEPGQPVTYHGSYTPGDLPAILSQTDVAVVPSRSENYPTVVRECLHAGTPVIGPEVGGVPEIIQDGDNGLLFRVGDDADLAGKINFIVETPDVIALLRRRIQPVRTIAEDADWYAGLYRQILDGDTASPLALDRLTSIQTDLFSQARQLQADLVQAHDTEKAQQRQLDFWQRQLANREAEDAQHRRARRQISERVDLVRAQLGGDAASPGDLPACRQPYDILIPIYNAREHVQRCVESVIRHTDPVHPVYLLDDASPDPAILPLLYDFERNHPQVKVVPSECNGGFIANINRGFGLSRNPVVILNSDTEVTPGWLERLDRCAASDPRIGIVSPLSNNATLLSVPEMNAANHLPDGVTPTRAAEIVARVSPRAYPRLPTAVGFCMLITRQTLDCIGEFDLAFGLGYGEENDFCMRAWQAGFETAACDDAYVHHYGEASFSQVKQIDARRLRNQALLDKRWPQYHHTVRAYCHLNPLRLVQERLEAAIHRRAGEARPHVLHVIHSYGVLAGTELFTKNLADGLAESYRSTVFYPVAQPDLWTDITSERLNEHTRLLRISRENAVPKDYFSGFPAELTNSVMETSFARVLAGGDYDIVHFQHLGGWPTLLLPFIAKSFGKIVILSLHDYFLLCPEYHLVLPEARRCGKPGVQPDDAECQRCLAAKRYTPSGMQTPLTEYLAERAAITRQIVEAVDVIIAPSIFVRNRYVQAYGEAISGKIVVIPHGVDVPRRSPRPPRQKTLRVAFLGNMTDRKGGHVLLEAARKLRGKPVRFEVFGNVQPEFVDAAAQAGVILHGPYRPETLPRLLAGVDLAAILSVVDEVFCLTLSEAQAMGVPVIASSVGAMSERVVDGLTGFLVPPGDADALADRLLALAADARSLQPVIAGLAALKVKSTAENVADYGRLYAEMLGGRGVESQWLRSVLAGGASHPVEQADPGTVLQALLESDDLPAALEANHSRLNAGLLALVRLNASAARADGDAELAEGLGALGEYIERVVFNGIRAE